MYKYLVAFVLLTPLIGVWLVEGGEFGPSIGTAGEPNGATLAFAVYAGIVAVAGWLTRGRGRVRTAPLQRPPADVALSAFARSLLLLNVGFLLLFLFAFDATRVWSGDVGKGEFRSTLGPLAALPNLMTKLVLPAMLAYAAALYRRSSRLPAQRRLMAANFAVLFVIGASWGFKSTALFVLVPALLILNWEMRFRTLLLLAAAFAATLSGFFLLFDADIGESIDVQTFLLMRLTVFQGDVSWLVWELYRQGERFPAYAPTLLAAVGDTVLTLAGLSRADFQNWVLHHYDLMLTQITGAPLEQIAEGHSVTATPFSEGLIAGGLFGMLFFALLAGLLVGRMHAFIRRALVRGQDVRAALGATYFVFYVFAWLNGGAVVQLFHVSMFVSMGLTVLAIDVMRRLTLRPALRAAPA